MARKRRLLFGRGSVLAVVGEEGMFWLCQVPQNVYADAADVFNVRWLETADDDRGLKYERHGTEKNGLELEFVVCEAATKVDKSGKKFEITKTEKKRLEKALAEMKAGAEPSWKKVIDEEEAQQEKEEEEEEIEDDKMEVDNGEAEEQDKKPKRRKRKADEEDVDEDEADGPASKAAKDKKGKKKPVAKTKSQSKKGTCQKYHCLSCEGSRK